MKTYLNPGFWQKKLFPALLALSILACSITPDILPTPGGNTITPTFPTPGETQIIENNGGLKEIPLQVGYGVQGSFYELFFTDPTSPEADREEGGPDKQLVAAIDSARISVDVAAYSFSLYSIQRALLNAFNRGVQVRVVMESDNMTDSVPQALQGAGIPMIGDQRQGLMHDKFIIIDRNEVWTGSMNFTYSGTYDYNNNLIRIRSSQLADDYTVEWSGEKFVIDAKSVSSVEYKTLKDVEWPYAHDVVIKKTNGISQELSQTSLPNEGIEVGDLTFIKIRQIY